MRPSIACSARFGSNARRLGKSGSVDSVTAAAVAEVRVGALRQQALQLVRAKRSMVTLSRRWRPVLRLSLGAVTDEVLVNCKPARSGRVPINALRERLAKLEPAFASVLQPLAQIERSC